MQKGGEEYRQEWGNAKLAAASLKWSPRVLQIGENYAGVVYMKDGLVLKEDIHLRPAVQQHLALLICGQSKEGQ